MRQPGDGSATAATVEHAIKGLLDGNGVHCEGQSCDKMPIGCVQWGKQIAAFLRASGVSAGLYDEHWADNIYVCQPGETDPWLCLWDCWHVGEGAWDEGAVGCGVRWPIPGSGSFCGTERIANPNPGTPPSTPPPTQPPPSANDYGCPAPRPERVWTAGTLPPGWGTEEIGRPRWVIDSSPHGGWIDTTANVFRNWPYCNSIGMGDGGDTGYPPRAACPVRPDGHPERTSCERYLADGDWVVVAEGGATCESNPSNSAQFRRTSDAGTCKLCNQSNAVCSQAW
jgi:hypothetical protein